MDALLVLRKCVIVLAVLGQPTAAQAVLDSLCREEVPTKPLCAPLVRGGSDDTVVGWQNQQHTMSSSPFRRCDYCNSNERSSEYEPRYARRAWTLFPSTRKLCCPKCQQKGREEERLALAMLRVHAGLLGRRMLAEPMERYGDVPMRKTHRIVMQGHAGEVDVCKLHDQYHGLDGSWNVPVNAKGVRVVKKYRMDEPMALYGQEHDVLVLNEPQAAYGTKLANQWKRLKEQYPDVLLIQRDGDDYHMLGNDAFEAVSIHPELRFEVHYTAKAPLDKHAWFPFEQLELVLPKLVRSGWRVAICDKIEGPPVPGVVLEPMEQYRRMKPQFRHSLLVLRDHLGYLMLYKDAEKAAKVIGVNYPGNGPFRIAKCMLEQVLDQLVASGYRIAVVIDPVVDDPRNARQQDLWDEIPADETLVAEPAEGYGKPYAFPKKEEVRLCLAARPHGTVVEVQVNWLSWRSGEGMRTVHLDLCGGRASSETGYRSHFLHFSGLNPLTEDAVVELATEFCEERFHELNPGVDSAQQSLF